MKKLLSNLANAVLSKKQMKQIKGGYGGGGSGWCYHYFCECGGKIFSNVGNYQQYVSDCQANCSPGEPINCSFGPSNWC
ncbi:MAG: hypothetical protein ACK4GN_17440 [Runella sp.]